MKRDPASGRVRASGGAPRSRPARRKRLATTALASSFACSLVLSPLGPRAEEPGGRALSPLGPRAEEPRLAPARPPLAPGPLLSPGRFVRIPGPNPILTPGEEGAWDDEIIEAADAFEDFGTYYLYYHGNGGSGYQIGVATASHPLGPFRRVGSGPALARGPAGSWDEVHVACASILKEAPDKYRMWYSGYGKAKEFRKWGIGLASASSPAGPWKKHEGNPIIAHFGYVGGVVRAGGKYRLYTAHPIGSTGPDYSPISLATADRPEGPWRIFRDNPVLREEEPGEWDDEGFSEGEVLYHGGAYHIFYGGAKLHRERIRTRESIGYAWSPDGVHFTKLEQNPVAPREGEPNAAAYAEVHAIIEPPFVYLYHTLRYREPWRERFRGRFPVVEDLGVQVLALERPFAIAVPVVDIPSLAPGTTTSLALAPSVALSEISRASITARGSYCKQATRALRLHVRSSADGRSYDTEDLAAFELALSPGRAVQRTVRLETGIRFVKVLVENPDPSAEVRNVRVTATLAAP